MTNLDVGPGELILTFLVALISIGPRNLPRAWREIAGRPLLRWACMLLLPYLALSVLAPNLAIPYLTIPGQALVAVAVLLAALELVRPRHEEPHVILIRLFVTAGATCLFTAIGMAVGIYPMELLRAYLTPGISLVAATVTENFIAYLRVAFSIGFGLALPVVVYQAVSVVSPGLSGDDQRLLLRLQPLVFGAFCLGTLFGYLITLPYALSFLLGFALDLADVRIRISDYVRFAVTLLFWTGMAYALPAVMLILARMGLVTPQRFASFRRYAIPIFFVIAAIVTPTPDPLNQILLATPMAVLYEVGILAARLATRAPAAAVPA
jgi:sec-independent protein translocase protein TatC